MEAGQDLEAFYGRRGQRFKQPDTVVRYVSALQKGRSFGGVRIDGLISHGWLKRYSWTIDFDRREFVFGAKE